MGESKTGMTVAATGTRRLADAVRAAKIAAAHRTDVVVDIREADRARLEIFAEELQPIVDAVPAEDELFDFSLSGGPQPRFWIDGTAHVTMARDRRTYRFVRETRLGRVTLAESTESRAIVDRVTQYVAERIVERDKAFAVADGLGSRGSERASPVHSAGDEPLRLPSPPSRHGGGFVTAAAWMMIGVVLGVAILLLVAALRGVPVI